MSDADWKSKKLSDYANATFTTSSKDLRPDMRTPPPMPSRTPTSRRRSLGDSANAAHVDQAGIWVHVEVDSAGIPTTFAAIEVDDTVTQWRYVRDQEYRSIDRLPSRGIFFFLY